jgi:hypothetical protein
MKVHLSFLSSITIIALSLSACSLTGTGEPADFPHSSATNALELEETSTNIATSVQPTSTKQPTLAPTPTAHQTTWTAQPTLTGNVAVEAINNMIATNGGCKLPCWWGITAGETSWVNASILLSRFSPNVTSNGPFDFTRDDNIHHTVIDYSVSFKIPNERIGQGASINVFDGVVSIVYVGSESTGEIFDIPNLLSEYGEPTSIFIKAYSNTPTGKLPFYIVLYYPDHRFMAVFEFEGNKIGESIRFCYKPSTPRIYIWSKDESEHVNSYRVSDWVLGSNNTGLKDIEEASNLSTKIFYQQFTNATSVSCFETPSILW